MKTVFKTALLVGCILVVPAGQAIAACGLGSTIWEGNDSFGAKVVAFTTNWFTFKAFSTTFEVSGCTEKDSIFKSDASDAKVRHFASKNLDHLAADMARGSGEHLDAFAHLIQLEDRDLAEFRQLTQDHFAELFPHDATTSGEMLDALGRLMAEDEALTAYVRS